MSRARVVVIGAGPAGLAAGAAAAECGVECLVLDEAGVAGGQYLRPPAGEKIAHPLRTKFAASGARLCLGESVWHADASRRLLYTTSSTLSYDALVVATGAYDRPLAAIGWQLNNVMTAGAAQLLLKQGVALPQPVLLAGSGPFAFALADRMSRANIGVAEICLTHVPKMANAARYSPSVLSEGLRYLSQVSASRIRVRSGWGLSEVVGDERGDVCGAWVVRLKGRRLSGERRYVECRAVAAGYGYLPQLAVFDLLDCELRYDSLHRTWFVRVDQGSTATSVQGVFAAGEPTGIGGHRKALAEGFLAGIEAAASILGRNRPAVRPLRKRVNRMRRFAQAAAPALAPPPLAPLLADDSVVCRCEGVTASQIGLAALDGATTVSGVRLRTRAGMGVCQARMCMQMCGELIESSHRLEDGAAGRIAARTPMRPITVRDGSA